MERIVDLDQAQRWHFTFEMMERGYCSTAALRDLRNQFNELLNVWKQNGDIAESVVNSGIQSGAGDAASSTIRSALDTFDTGNPVELWIAYMFSSEEAPTGYYKLADLLNIEMAVSVTTRAPYLYTWHMGITRNFVMKFAVNTVLHPNISVILHAFAAEIMYSMHPELLYVMTKPGGGMETILQRAFYDDIGTAIFSTWKDMVVYDYVDGVKLFSIPAHLGERRLLWSGSVEDFNWPRHGGTGGMYFLADIITLSQPFYSFAVCKGNVDLVAEFFSRFVTTPAILKRMLSKALLQRKDGVAEILIQLGKKSGIFYQCRDMNIVAGTAFELALANGNVALKKAATSMLMDSSLPLKIQIQELYDAGLEVAAQFLNMLLVADAEPGLYMPREIIEKIVAYNLSNGTDK